MLQLDTARPSMENALAFQKIFWTWKKNYLLKNNCHVENVRLFCFAEKVVFFHCLPKYLNLQLKQGCFPTDLILFEVPISCKATEAPSLQLINRRFFLAL